MNEGDTNPEESMRGKQTLLRSDGGLCVWEEAVERSKTSQSLAGFSGPTGGVYVRRAGEWRL